MIEIERMEGIGKYEVDEQEGVRVYKVPGGRAFLVVRKNTIEVRTDRQLGEKLRGDYESVMESRYFGRGGIEVVRSGQLTDEEMCDLVRLSYNLTAGG